MLLQDLEACRTPEDVVNSFREWERQASSLFAAKDASR
jgi:hypothetical protein